MDLPNHRRHRGLAFRFERSLGIKRDDAEILVGQILNRDPLDIIERYLLNLVEVFAAEVEVTSQKPVGAEVGRLTAHSTERS